MAGRAGKGLCDYLHLRMKDAAVALSPPLLPSLGAITLVNGLARVLSEGVATMLLAAYAVIDERWPFFPYLRKVGGCNGAKRLPTRGMNPTALPNPHHEPMEPTRPLQIPMPRIGFTIQRHFQTNVASEQETAIERNGARGQKKILKLCENLSNYRFGTHSKEKWETTTSPKRPLLCGRSQREHPVHEIRDKDE